MPDKEFEKYVRLYRGNVFRLAYSYLKNTADADDVCQEAFLKLLCFDGGFPSDEDCRRWLLRVAANLSKNLLNSCRRRNTEELSEDIPAKEAEGGGEIRELIKKLPPKYSEVIHLFYYEGYSVNEIALMLEISVTAVTTRLSRGRKKLRMLLTEGTDYDKTRISGLL